MRDKNWYEHYTKKLGGKLILDRKGFEKNLENDRPFIEILKTHVKHGSKILEIGCGLGRNTISMSLKGYEILTVDRDEKMLRTAKKNVKKWGKRTRFKKANIREIDKIFKNRKFDACVHQSVMEHFEKNEISFLLKKQLKIAEKVIFSVPLKTKRNKDYFKGGLIKYRNLWSGDYWIKNILKDFRIIDHKLIRQRTDNLVIVLVS
jgi:2-polyprenyl-3-methyl-5-hydroxy-6-metoxy-1,4-benzoquinol methylase